MLEFHPLARKRFSAARHVELLEQFRELLITDGMASMDEYGDMLKWALPSKDGWCRYFHVFHPGFCSFDDKFKGTIHFHGGEIRGTVLLGELEHYSYEATESEDGDRFLAGVAYNLKKHTQVQKPGDSYALQPMVPHWVKPNMLTLTFFEEQDNERMGDLVNPAGDETDEHFWEQADADAQIPELLRQIESTISALALTA